jgi:hypothetical protein
MNRRNARTTSRFQVESLEGRNAPSHFAAHAIVAHAVTSSVSTTRHQEIQSLDRNEHSARDASHDTSNDSSNDSTTDPSRDTSSKS